MVRVSDPAELHVRVGYLRKMFEQQGNTVRVEGVRWSSPCFRCEESGGEESKGKQITAGEGPDWAAAKLRLGFVTPPALDNWRDF